MDRKYPSGAKKRKLKEQNLKQIEKLTKISTFLDRKSTSASTSEQTVTGELESSTDSDLLHKNEAVSAIEPACSSANVNESPVADSDLLHKNEAVSAIEPGCSFVNVNGSSASDFPSADPVYWPDCMLDAFREQCIQLGPHYFQNRSVTGKYIESKQVQKSQNRYFSDSLFTRKLKNGDTVERIWLVYSPSTGKVFCYHCKLLSNYKLNSTFASHGFCNWKKADEAIISHENSLEHRNAINSWLYRKKMSSRVDSQLVQEITLESQYWGEVLKRTVAVIKFLCLRGLAFRGKNENFGVYNNGNYLGILELISQFDPFLKEHISKHGNHGKGKPSYLSKTIAEELIHLMGEKVLNTIVSEIKESNYYSLIVDSSPDCSHVDQLSIVCRYLHLGEVKERFLCFKQIESHTGQSLFNEVKSFLDSKNIPLSQCRGLSCDNAANMSGQYKGFQAQLKKENKFAPFVPCAGHSLNLVGVSAVESCLEALKFFSYLQRLYVYFSSSPRKWAMLLRNLEPDLNDKLLHLKSLSQTRWCCHYESVKALRINYDNILCVLDIICENAEEKHESRREAKSLKKKLMKFESAFMCVLWHEILERFDKVSVRLQKPTLDLLTGCKLLESLVTFTANERGNFDKYEKEANRLCEKYLPGFEDTSERQPKKRYADGNALNETILNGRKKFEVETFLVIIDNLCSGLNNRLQSYKTFQSQFQFLVDCKVSGTVDETSLNNCLSFYNEDLDESLKLEIKHFYDFVKSINEVSCQEITKYMYENDLIGVFPNVFVALKLYLVIPITNCEAERSFSKMALIKNKLRSTMLEPRLDGLTIMSLEHDITTELSFDEVLKSFANLKARKKIF